MTRRLNLFRYDQPHDGRSAGYQVVMTREQAVERQTAGIGTILHHPLFPDPKAREFAGLPPPIEPPREARPKKHR